MKLTAELIRQRIKSRDNLGLIERDLSIRNKRGEMVHFILNPAQALYWKKRTRRNLILKARQEGISKIIDADQLIDCLKAPTKAVVISHEKEATRRLFSAVRGFVEGMKTPPTTSIDSKSEIQFPTIPSSYFIGTASQKAFGRGDTVERAHLSEAAFYDNLERILGGIAEAAEYGQIDIETTPNGREEFYDMWERAKRGLSSYTPIFIPWFINREYSTDNMTEKERAGLSPNVQSMFSIPPADFLGDLSKEERSLVNRVKIEYDIDLTAGELKWRRYKIWDRGMMFFQEYPEDDVSCFLQTGRSVFTTILTDQSRRVPLDDFERWQAPEATKQALKERRMFGGVDGAEGSLTGDAHVFSVIDIDREEGKGYAIFEYHSNEPIDVFCDKVSKICHAFHIELGVEKNGVGNAHVLRFRQLGVRFTEWETTASSRPVMLTDLEEAYRKEELIETYPEAEDEARNMTYSESNRADHGPGKHDDRVFARAIAWQMSKRPTAGISFA